MVETIYPTVEEIQYNNTIAIEMFRRSKRDQAKTISVSYIKKAIDAMKVVPGDLYDKAALLLLELTRIHAFESGNKRTAFLTTKKFVVTNGERFNIPDTENNVKIMIGIRENYYTQKEIKEWIKHGKIKAFKR
jgi:death-on-curing family protein